MTLLSDALARLLSLSELVDAHAHARTELVKVSDVIVKTLIEHLPAESSALVDKATYTVERVTWLLYETRETPAFPHPFGSYALRRDEIVLADVRTTIVKGAKTPARLLGGRNARLARWPTSATRLDRDTAISYDLPLAAEDDLWSLPASCPRSWMPSLWAWPTAATSSVKSPQGLVILV